MAAASYSTTTSGTTLPKLWKKIQGKLIHGFNVKCEEWNLIQDLKEFDVQFSAREVTAPIDISEHGGGASIVEGGYEAVGLPGIQDPTHWMPLPLPPTV